MFGFRPLQLNDFRISSKFIGGDIWCLCAQRWAQAYNAGMAPKIFLQATHEKTLDYAPFEILRTFAIDKDEADRRLDDLNAQREKLNKLL